MQRTINGFLPDGALINGVANFYRSTKPTTRIDGSMLGIGDVWFNSSTGVQGFWNGTYWLGQPIYIGSGNFVAATGTVNSVSKAALQSYLLTEFCYQYFNAGTIDATNKWDFTVRGLRSDGATGIGYTPLTGLSITQNNPPVASNLISIPVNVLASADFNSNAYGFSISFTRNGTAGGLFINATATYYRIL